MINQAKDGGLPASFAYDEAGNMLTERTWGFAGVGSSRTMAYDAANRMTTLTPSTGASATFTYDEFGRMKTRASGGTTATYAYVGAGETIRRITRAGTLTTPTTDLLDPDETRVASQSGTALGDVRWLVFDLLGSVGASEAATTTAIVESTRNDAFGEVVGVYPTTGTTVPWKFRGLLDVSPNGDPLYDMGARYYSPHTGSFTQIDTQAGDAQSPASMNRYLYAESNPSSLIDPSGHAVINKDLCGNPNQDRCDGNGGGVDNTNNGDNPGGNTGNGTGSGGSCAECTSTGSNTNSGGSDPPPPPPPTVNLTFVGNVLVDDAGVPVTEDGAYALAFYCTNEGPNSWVDLDAACAGWMGWLQAQADADAEFCRQNSAVCAAQDEANALTVLLVADLALTAVSVGLDSGFTLPTAGAITARLAQLSNTLANSSRYLSGLVQRLTARARTPSGIWDSSFVRWGNHGAGAWNEVIQFARLGRPRNLPWAQPVIDDIQGRTVTSMKLIDTSKPSWTGSMNRAINELAGYKGSSGANGTRVVLAEDFDVRVLRVTINPWALSWKTEQGLFDAYRRAQELGVRLELTAIP